MIQGPYVSNRGPSRYHYPAKDKYHFHIQYDVREIVQLNKGPIRLPYGQSQVIVQIPSRFLFIIVPLLHLSK